MDPDATLRELRNIVNCPDDFTVEYAAELFAALDDWLSSGGFKPADWAGVR